MAVKEIAKQRGMATAEGIAARANDAGGDLNSDAADDAANMAAAYATHTAADARDRDRVRRKLTTLRGAAHAARRRQPDAAEPQT